MQPRYQFEFISSGMGVVSYRYSHREGSGRIEYRVHAEPFDLSHTSLNREDYAAQVEASIGLLHVGFGSEPIPQDLVDEFNAYRQSQHDLFLDWLSRNPELIQYADADAMKPKALQMPGARFDCQQRRWIRNAPSSDPGTGMAT